MERHDSTDSKINLTDSSGNILSMKDLVSDDSLDNLSIDEKTGCVDIDLPFVPRDKGLFNVCLLVGLNYMTGEAYVKSVFPSQVSFLFAFFVCYLPYKREALHWSTQLNYILFLSCVQWVSQIYAVNFVQINIQNHFANLLKKR